MFLRPFGPYQVISAASGYTLVNLLTVQIPKYKVSTRNHDKDYCIFRHLVFLGISDQRAPKSYLRQYVRDSSKGSFVGDVSKRSQGQGHQQINIKCMCVYIYIHTCVHTSNCMHVYLYTYNIHMYILNLNRHVYMCIEGPVYLLKTLSGIFQVYMAEPSDSS